MLSLVNRTATLIIIFGFALTTIARAGDDLRLATVAAANGYTYQWMMTETGATLLRPGVRVVIRAGRLLYEVNDATPVADSVPRYDGRDILISRTLAARLRDIALNYPFPAQSTVGETPIRMAKGALTINARQIPGREALALSGTGPANVPVTVTLKAEMSADLPVLTLMVKTVMTAKNGTFSADVGYGQDTHPNTLLAATVTSVDGSASADIRFVIGVPSVRLKSSALDDWPKK